MCLVPVSCSEKPMWTPISDSPSRQINTLKIEVINIPSASWGQQDGLQVILKTQLARALSDTL